MNRWAWYLAVVGLSAGCGGGGAATDQSRTSWPPAALAQVDSGNAAYRAEEFDDAREHFRRATEAGPRVAAAWFGLYMAEHALGHIEAADSALARTRGGAGGDVQHTPDSSP
jgi:hypothetical protein